MSQPSKKVQPTANPSGEQRRMHSGSVPGVGSMGVPTTSTGPHATNLDTLRKIAEAATPGPWEAYDSNEGMDPAYSPMWCVANEEFHNPTTGDDEDWMGVEIHVGDKADSDHIATFDPPTVLALIEEIGRLQSENDTLADLAKARHEWNKNKRAELQARLEQAEQAVARVREVCESDAFECNTREWGNLEAVTTDNVLCALDGDQA